MSNNENLILPEWLEELTENDPEIIFWDGFDAAIIGVGKRCGIPDVLIYDYEKMVEILVNDGGSPEEAMEYLDFNVVGAYVGEHTPITIQTCIT
jgi:hypothetical protein